MDLEIIKKLSEKRDGGLKKLAADIGMSEQNLHRCIRNNKIQATDLEKIAGLLHADIKVFFDDPSISQTGDNSGASITGDVTINAAPSGEAEVLKERVAALQERIGEKDALIAEKERIIGEKERLVAEKQQLIDEKERTIRFLLGGQK